MKESEKVLIIKLGYSEILDKENNSGEFEVSLGDILRTTPLLHLYKGDKVTWLTDPKAYPLLKDNDYIDRLLPYDLTRVLQLQHEEFDSVINLEKIPGLCAFSDKINSWKNYGFRFESKSGKAKAHERALDALALSSDFKMKKSNQKSAQELLFEMVGKQWNNEEYILGYKPKTIGSWDVALNTLVGKKWPNKQWPIEYWNTLENNLINTGFKVTRQDRQGKEVNENLYGYMDWINSSKLIVTNDSLGLHLGIALKKNVLGLFGPTPDKEVHFYGRGEAILPKHKNCIPCFSSECNKKEFCLNTIMPEKVYNKILNYFPNKI